MQKYQIIFVINALLIGEKAGDVYINCRKHQPDTKRETKHLSQAFPLLHMPTFPGQDIQKISSIFYREKS